MSEDKNSIAYISRIINELVPTAEIRVFPEYRFIIQLEGNSIEVNFERDIIDDFDVALEKYRNSNYFHTLENRIKFRIYILLGKEGLLPDFDISSEILNEKGEWLKSYSADMKFENWFCGILYEGLKLLSGSLEATLSGTDLELNEIRTDKEFVDSLINYYEEKGNLTSRGVEIESLSFLKAAAVCVILEREKSKKETAIPRLKKGYDRDIYFILSEIRKDPFRDIKLPECIYEFAIQQKTTIEEKESVKKIKTIIKDEGNKLDQLLEKLDPRLKERRKGAWLTFASDNPDRLSQAANSMVELLDQVIGKVCKDTELAVFLKNKYQTHEETKWIDATRKWISETKSNLHRVKHHIDQQSEQLTKSLLTSAESIMLVILE